jgi:hypothetical protein
MRRVALLACLCLVVAGACSKNDDTGELPKVCEDYITRYTCFLGKTNAKTDSVQTVRKGWVAAAAGGGPARSQVARSCSEQLELQRKEFASKGCGD